MKPDLLRRSAAHDCAPVRYGRWNRFLARALAPSLDRQLATGHLPRSGTPPAVRAQQIVSSAGRRELAQRWTDVLARAGRPPVPHTPRGPLCRGAIAAAEGDVREMIGVLAGALPIAACGAALAGWLLSDGTGPLHNHRCPFELRGVVREAIRRMDPFADIAADEAAPQRPDCCG